MTGVYQRPSVFAAWMTRRGSGGEATSHTHKDFVPRPSVATEIELASNPMFARQPTPRQQGSSASLFALSRTRTRGESALSSSYSNAPSLYSTSSSIAGVSGEVAEVKQQMAAMAQAQQAQEKRHAEQMAAMAELLRLAQAQAQGLAFTPAVVRRLSVSGAASALPPPAPPPSKHRARPAAPEEDDPPPPPDDE